MNRVDGLVKVTGAARYAAEHPGARPALRLGRLERDRQGPHRRDSRRRGARGARCRRRHHAREPAARRLARHELRRRGGGARLAVSRPLRRQDRVQRPAAGAGGRRNARGRARRRGARRHRLRARAAQHRHPGRARREVRAQEASAATSRLPKSARRCEEGLRRRPDQAFGHLPPAGASSQPDGDARHHRDLGRRRQDHRARQDAGRAERPEVPGVDLRLLRRKTCTC